jgi:hypothetical protein
VMTAQPNDDAESSSEEAERDDDDPDFAPEHGYTAIVEEAPAVTSRMYPTPS